MALVRDIEWEACLIEPRRNPELERQIRQEGGLGSKLAAVGKLLGTSRVQVMHLSIQVHFDYRTWV